MTSPILAAALLAGPPLRTATTSDMLLLGLVTGLIGMGLAFCFGVYDR